MPLTKVSYSMITGADVNVLDYGADKTGANDSTVAIQSALDTGKNVYVPSGNYLISSTLYLRANGQALVGEGFSGINVVSAVALNNTNLSQIFTTSAITMLNTGNYSSPQVRNICFNGTGNATNGIVMSPVSSPLVFNAYVENVYIGDVVNIALDTGYTVDSTFIRISIQGFNSGSAAFTDTGIKNGATNNTYIGCWLHGCKKSLVASGTVAHFFGCTFTSFPYDPSYAHIYIDPTTSGTAKYSFSGCYFETSTILKTNANQYGTIVFSDCFLQSNNPLNMFDVTSTFGGDLFITNCRLNEDSASYNIAADAPTRVGISLNGQIPLTLSGTAATTKITPGAFFLNTSTFSNPLNVGFSVKFSSATNNGGEGGSEIINTSTSANSDVNPALIITKGSATTTSSQRFMQFFANAGAQPMGGIAGNGATAVQFVSLSDRRLKKNIQPVKSALDKIMSLPVVSYDWVSHEDHVSAGFIAQDVETIFPEFVSENPDDGMKMLGGNVHGIVPYLVRAIQELKAAFDTYKKEHP